MAPTSLLLIISLTLLEQQFPSPLSKKALINKSEITNTQPRFLLRPTHILTLHPTSLDPIRYTSPKKFALNFHKFTPHRHWHFHI
ncbi:putative mitochondrial protein [Trifolium repens]|nr:putative mitochondrial protein [Trifolium repens]